MDIMIVKSNVAKAGSEVISSAELFNADIKRLLAIIESINTVWNGADALSYINILRDKYIVDLNKMSESITAHGDYLKKVPEAYTIFDESFASQNIDV